MPDMLEVVSQAGGVGLGILAIYLNHLERKEVREKQEKEFEKNRLERKENQDLMRKQIALTDVRIIRVEEELRGINSKIGDLKKIALNKKK